MKRFVFYMIFSFKYKKNMQQKLSIRLNKLRDDSIYIAISKGLLVLFSNGIFFYYLLFGI